MEINNGFGSAQWLCLTTLAPSSHSNPSHLSQTHTPYTQTYATL